MAIIRQAEARDNADIASLAEEAGLTVDPEAESRLDHSRLFVCAPAVDEPGQVVGFILGWMVADELEVVDVAVRPAARRGGVGRRLIEHLLEVSAQKGARTAHLEVREHNRAAQLLYQSVGFEPVGRRARYYADGEDALLFRCCIPSRP